jgi:hypothetical protein
MPTPTTEPIDPLKAKSTHGTAAAQAAIKREIENILSSYVGWFDPFSELIQNALDSTDERAESEGADYTPQIRIIIDVKENTLTVSDNGTGLTREKYEQFLAPSFSFKSGKTRGHKGVGATYLAYGFNSIQIATNTPDYEYVAKMEGARRWLSDLSPASNPLLIHDKAGCADAEFASFDRGVSVTVRFDKTTVPGDLAWIKADSVEPWIAILLTKTGLGAICGKAKAIAHIAVRSKAGVWTRAELKGAEYNWPHKLVPKARRLREVQMKADELYKRDGKDYRMPATFRGLDALWDEYGPHELAEFITLSDEENDILKRFTPTVYLFYAYSTKVFSTYNESLMVRANVEILKAGIQIGANNMPQGEVIQIPLARNIGRQNQVHFVAHFENCRPDLGRKGFQKEVISFCETVSRKLIEGPFFKQRQAFKPATGAKSDLSRESAIDDWKAEMEEHEKSAPLNLANANFFLPTKRVSITSTPTREQDVIALFNQLVAGGVIRGLRIMSTNERFTYDGMYKIAFTPPEENHLFDRDSNPLGITRENFHPQDFVSRPRIMEYKFSLDGLIEDIESGEKNAKDLGLVIVWETGNSYKQNFHIVSLLDEDNLSERQYHGVTHVIQNYQSDTRVMDMIVLSELIDYLNNPESAVERQKQKYDA